MNWGPFYEKQTFKKKSHNAKKTERGTLWDFSKSNLSENILKIEGGHFDEFFPEKKSHRAENALSEYPLAQLTFFDGVKILLRKLSKNCETCKIVRIVRKVDHSQ